MTNVFAAPRELLARKAPHGKPCTNCGLCCLATKCDLALHVFGGEKRAPCPALIWGANGKSGCGLASDPDIPENMREAAATLIYAGRGCDARFNGERNDQAFTARMNREDATFRAAEISAARAAWGLAP